MPIRGWWLSEGLQVEEHLNVQHKKSTELDVNFPQSLCFVVLESGRTEKGEFWRFEGFTSVLFVVSLFYVIR